MSILHVGYMGQDALLTIDAATDAERVATLQAAVTVRAKNSAMRVE
jgi:hypothetical protein